MSDLFPQLGLPPMTDAERKRTRRRLSQRPRGYAALPGTGPEGETCGSCKHIRRSDTGIRIYPKCNLNRAAWTASQRTDIRVRWPACAKWENPEA